MSLSFDLYLPGISGSDGLPLRFYFYSRCNTSLLSPRLRLACSVSGFFMLSSLCSWLGASGSFSWLPDLLRNFWSERCVYEKRGIKGRNKGKFLFKFQVLDPRGGDNCQVPIIEKSCNIIHGWQLASALGQEDIIFNQPGKTQLCKFRHHLITSFPTNYTYLFTSHNVNTFFYLLVSDWEVSALIKSHTTFY